MPKLPGFDMIERRVTQDEYQVQSYRGGIVEGAQAEAATERVRAAEKFTSAAQKIGDEALGERDRSEYAQARSAFLRAKVGADNAFADDPDHGTWAPRYEQQLGQAQQSIAGGISSGRVRAAFNDQAALDVAQGAAAVASKSQARVKDEGRAQLADVIAGNREAALNSDDPATREGLINATIESIAAARSSGFLSAQEEQHYRESFVKSYEVDRANRIAAGLQSGLNKAATALVSDPAKFGAMQSEILQRIDASGLHEDHKAPLRAAANSALASSALQGQIAADPVRAKADIAGGAWDGYLDADKKAMALTAADLQITRNANRAEQQRRQASQVAEDKIIQQISADDKSLSVMGIEQNQALSPAKKSEMIGVLRQSTQPDPPSAISRDTMLGLAKRIHADDADPLKLRDSSVINEAFADGTLSRVDFYRLRQEFADAQTSDGAPLGRRKENYLQSIEPLIDKTDPALGIDDATGKQQFYDYTQTVDRAVERYKKEGKDPYDLFDPSKPDYLGKPAALEPFQKPLPEADASGPVPQGAERPPLESIMGRDLIGEAERAGLPRRKVNAFLNKKWDQARTAGYSDEEITTYLATGADPRSDRPPLGALLPRQQDAREGIGLRFAGVSDDDVRAYRDQEWEKARAAGYSDDDIIKYRENSPPARPSLDSIYRRYTTAEARLAGYSDDEIHTYHKEKLKWLPRVFDASMDGMRRHGFGLAPAGAEVARQMALELGLSESDANAAMRAVYALRQIRGAANRMPMYGPPKALWGK